jgi:hypothetical protein
MASLSADLSALPEGHAASFAADPDNAAGALSWTPNAGEIGEYLVSFTATDALTGTGVTLIRVFEPQDAMDGDFPDENLPPVLPRVSFASPNPTPGSVSFTLKLSQASHVAWGVWDLQGRLVHQQELDLLAGNHALRWTGTSMAGRPAGAGVYFARIRVAGDSFTRRFVRL